MGDPRKINLNLPADYISGPSGKVRDWLNANTSALRALTEEQIVSRIRATLGLQIQALNDRDLEPLVQEWAKNKGILLSKPGPGPGPTEPEIVARLKQVMGSIPISVNYRFQNGVATVDVSGATLKLYSGKVQHSISGSWGGELQFKTQAPGVAFAAAMSQKDWKLSLQFGKEAPNLSDLESVFKKGEAALRGALSQLDKVDWKNPGKTKQLLNPYIDPIKAAVDAASKSAKARAGDLSFGVWVGSGSPGGVAGGLQLTILF